VLEQIVFGPVVEPGAGGAELAVQLVGVERLIDPGEAGVEGGMARGEAGMARGVAGVAGGGRLAPPRPQVQPQEIAVGVAPEQGLRAVVVEPAAGGGVVVGIDVDGVGLRAIGEPRAGLP
jgi:hypothetical protein